MTEHHRNLLLAMAMLLAALMASPAGTETVDLHLHRYCAPGTFCGHTSLADYDDFVCKTVQEMNLIWEPTGISFRPTLLPVDSTSPTDPTGLPDGITHYYQVPGCAPGEAREIARAHWRNHVAKADTTAISMMLTRGTNRCCSGIPRTWKKLEDAYGLYCDAHPYRGVRGQGGLWAHEMGHHWSLSHTHGTCADPADGQNPAGDADAGIPKGCTIEHVSCDTSADCDQGGSCVPDGLPAVADTPADRCRLEACRATCSNDPGEKSCSSDADCDPGEGPCTCRGGADEDLQGNLLDGHTWFASTADEREVIPVATDLSYGSPHGSWCPVQVKSRSGGFTSGSDTTPPTEVTVRDVMSYHNMFCRGPYVLAGDRREAFSADQLTRVAACRSQIYPRDAGHLPDVCASHGGDSDHDGICDLDDNCASIRNTCQTDSDQDGFGDACDCPGAGQNSGDLDGDGIPDACDADRDGDGCYNDPAEDDHPDQAQLYEKTLFYVGCGGSGSETTYVSDAADTDGDGTINCRDPDDDDDGLCDAPGSGCTQVGDLCPEVPGELCVFPAGDVPCPPLWTFCGLDCVEHFLKITEVINPDPTTDLFMEPVWVVNRTLFAGPLRGQTAAESVAAIAGLAGSPLGSLASGAREAAAMPGLVALELWVREGGTERLVERIGEYDASQLWTGELARGGLLRLLPTTNPASGAQMLEVEVTPGIGVALGDAADRDGDGQPDAIDNCLELANAEQRDADGDGFGDACDGDLDGDGITDEADVARVRACAGADLSVEPPISEPAFFDGEDLGDPPAEPDPLAIALAVACAAADLDGDGDVDAADEAAAAALLGQPPGPSAFAGSGVATAAPAVPACADGAPLERARLLLDKLDRAPGAQRFTLKGRLAVALPLSPPLDPMTRGFSLRVTDGSGALLLNVEIPGGPGWEQAGTGFRYRDDTGLSGIDRVSLREVRRRRGDFVKVHVAGRSLDLPPTDPVLPLVAQLSLDPDAPATQQCGETGFLAAPERPSCRSAKSGERVVCR